MVQPKLVLNEGLGHAEIEPGAVAGTVGRPRNCRVYERGVTPAENCHIAALTVAAQPLELRDHDAGAQIRLRADHGVFVEGDGARSKQSHLQIGQLLARDRSVKRKFARELELAIAADLFGVPQPRFLAFRSRNAVRRERLQELSRQTGRPRAPTAALITSICHGEQCGAKNLCREINTTVKRRARRFCGEPKLAKYISRISRVDIGRANRVWSAINSPRLPAPAGVFRTAICRGIMKKSTAYWTALEKRLGMDRNIARRDFINGVAITVTSAGMKRAIPTLDAFARGQESYPSDEHDAANYPPLRPGLRGQYGEAIQEFAGIQSGKFRNISIGAPVPGEEYDLVIVGGGISGLSAAHFYRTALGESQKILILDNHDDFGGHAKRNEFRHSGRTYIGFGGTWSIATPFPYSYTAKSLLKELGIEVERYSEFVNRDLEEKYGLGAGIFFDKEHFGEDRLVTGRGRLPWKTFLEKAPLSEAARRDLIRLHGKNPDYMSGLSIEEKRARLARISYQEFLLTVAKMSPDALPIFFGNGGRNNKRVDTMPALEAAQHGAVGFNGLDLKLEENFNEGSFLFHFPDGNASIAPLLFRKLIPGTLPEKQSMNTIVQAPLDYGRLDEASSAVRIRLSSTVVRVQHEGDLEKAQAVRIAYIKDGKPHVVRGKHSIL